MVVHVACGCCARALLPVVGMIVFLRPSIVGVGQIFLYDLFVGVQAAGSVGWWRDRHHRHLQDRTVLYIVVAYFLDLLA